MRHAVALRGQCTRILTYRPGGVQPPQPTRQRQRVQPICKWVAARQGFSSEVCRSVELKLHCCVAATVFTRQFSQVATARVKPLHTNLRGLGPILPGISFLGLRASMCFGFTAAHMRTGNCGSRWATAAAASGAAASDDLPKYCLISTQSGRVSSRQTRTRVT